jgi:hypothetical protein
MKTTICIVFIMIVSGCSDSNSDSKTVTESNSVSILIDSNDTIQQDTEVYETHSYANFSIQLPSDFKRQPAKGYSDVFLFRTERKEQASLFLSYERCVSNKTNLNKMNNLQIIDVIFQSSADYPKHYSDFFPYIAEGSSTEWISFKKKDSNSSYAAFFRVVDRKDIDIPEMVAAQLVFYEIKRQFPGSVVDGNGRMFSPWRDYKNYAFVIDSGAWKYVFRVGDNLDENTLNKITKGIMEFKEISEPNNLDQ